MRGILFFLVSALFLCVCVARRDDIAQGFSALFFGNEAVSRGYLQGSIAYASQLQTTSSLERVDQVARSLLGISIISPLSVIDSQIAFASQMDKQEYEAMLNPGNEGETETNSPQASASPEQEQPKVRIETIRSDDRSITNHTEYSIDTNALLNQPISFQPDPGPYRVLILHTHATESYLPTDRNTDDEKNVVKVGEELAEKLNAQGIPTLHVKDHNDEPSYNGSYQKSAECAQRYLEQYPGIEIVIDLHRDAVAETAEGKLSLVADVAGKQAAQVMLVVGTDAGGLTHPNWQKNLSFALKLQQVLEESFPGFTRPTDIRTERFNQNLLDKYVIIEVGANGNTLSDALQSADLLADGLARLVHENME